MKKHISQLLFCTTILLYASALKGQNLKDDAANTKPDQSNKRRNMIDFLEISGSVDFYVQHGLAGKNHRAYTSFAGQNDEMSLGMVELDIKKHVDKVTFVTGLSFGPRSLQALPDEKIPLQNLYVAYQISDPLTIR